MESALLALSVCALDVPVQDSYSALGSGLYSVYRPSEILRIPSMQNRGTR